MQLIEVQTPEQHKKFLEAPAVILGDDPNYIRVLDKDTNDIFTPDNRLLKRGGKYILWIVEDDNGNLVGRIAAFVNPKYKNKIKAGGMGFFDSINDTKVSTLLLDAAKEWLMAEGMEAMDGPINFGERDRFWGVMVEGFLPPVYAMHYAKPYYKDLLEDYGFQMYYHQLCFGMPVTHILPEKFRNRYEELKNNTDYSFEHLKKSNLDKYAKDFCAVYNAAWASHGGGKTMSERQAILTFKSLKPVLDENIAFFLYFKGEPVGMWLNIPDINTIFKKFNGKLGIVEKIRFYLALKTGKASRAVGIIFGVVPEHQSLGLDALLIVSGDKVFKSKTNYQYYEMQWVGDFNPKMVNMTKSLDGELTRKLTTYRYLFDRTAKFERHPII